MARRPTVLNCMYASFFGCLLVYILEETMNKCSLFALVKSWFCRCHACYISLVVSFPYSQNLVSLVLASMGTDVQLSPSLLPFSKAFPVLVSTFWDWVTRILHNIHILDAHSGIIIFFICLSVIPDIVFSSDSFLELTQCFHGKVHWKPSEADRSEFSWYCIFLVLWSLCS